MSKKVNVGLLGLGTVGAGVFQLLSENGKLLEERTGASIKICKIVVRDLSKKRLVSVPSSLLSNQVEDVLNDPKIDLVVELIGGVEPAGSYVLQALRAGKHVVTANKALLAEKGAALFAEAAKSNVSLGFEASVAGGIPILKSIREGFIGNKIQEIYGIINGTANFILSEMSEKGEEFSKVLARAQKEGYAESDPSLDIKGTDAAQKLSLLISLGFGVEPPQKGLCVEGIDRITPLDIEIAKGFGYAIKLLAIAKERNGSIEARVHPTMIPLHHQLAQVGGVLNAIFLKGDAVGETLFVGRGAGMMPTASAVVSDIAMVAEGLIHPPIAKLRPAKILTVDEILSEYYLRFNVLDKPGVLAKIASYLGEGDISIASVYQRERDAGSKVPIVIMTHEAKEKNVQQAIQKIDKLDVVLEKTMLIRVLK